MCIQVASLNNMLLQIIVIIISILLLVSWTSSLRWSFVLVKLLLHFVVHEHARSPHWTELNLMDGCLEKCGGYTYLHLHLYSLFGDATQRIGSCILALRDGIYKDLCTLVRKISWWCRGSSAHPKDDTIVSSLLLQLIIKAEYTWIHSAAAASAHRVHSAMTVSGGGWTEEARRLA